MPERERCVDLLRHGEPLGGERLRGTQDDPVSARGWAQLRCAAAAAGAGWTHVLSSPARRCAEPAQALAAERGLGCTILPWLRERGFGAWEGLRLAEIPPADLGRFWGDPLGYTPPGAEPCVAFQARVLAGWQDLLSAPEPHPLVITHGGVIRVLLAEVLTLPAPVWSLIEVPYACRTRLRIPAPPWRPSLVFHGAVAVDAAPDQPPASGPGGGPGGVPGSVPGGSNR